MNPDATLRTLRPEEIHLPPYVTHLSRPAHRHPVALTVRKLNPVSPEPVNPVGWVGKKTYTVGKISLCQA